MKNAMSIDLEFWYSAELVRPYAKKGDDLIIEMTRPILDLLDRYDTKATFFVLGEVADRYPQLVKEIYELGHEIASHSYSHRTLFDLGKIGFEDEIKKSVCLLERITGERVEGFRAPTFSIDNNTKWAFDILEKYGFIYDSSIFPLRTNLYGVPNAPVSQYYPSADDVSKKASGPEERKIIELPLTVYGSRLFKIPISGGFYLRAILPGILKRLIREVNRDRPAIIYVHPWEVCPIMPRLKLSRSSRFITYYNLDTTLGKLTDLISTFKFTTMRDILYEI